MFLKRKDKSFNSDINFLLSKERQNLYDLDEAYRIVFDEILPKLSGQPWKGLA